MKALKAPFPLLQSPTLPSQSPRLPRLFSSFPPSESLEEAIYISPHVGVITWLKVNNAHWFQIVELMAWVKAGRSAQWSDTGEVNPFTPKSKECIRVHINK